MSQSKRLFFAINLPSQTKEALADIQNKIRSKNQRVDAKWVDPQIIHLTLHFWGWVNEDKLDILKNLIVRALVNIIPQEVRLGHLGGFPNLQKPRVIWVALEEGPVAECAFVTKSRRSERGEGKKSQEYTQYISRFFTEPQPLVRDCSRNGIRQQAPEGSDGVLKQIHARLKETLLNAGFEVDMRPWQAHLTLARLRMSQPLQGLNDVRVPQISWRINGVELMESILHREGPEYQVLYSQSLCP